MQSIPSLDLIQTLIIFADSPNMTGCAKVLGLSQGAISQQLAQLQRGLPHPLFETIGRKKLLTPYAQAICSEFRSSLQNAGPALERLNSEFGRARKSVFRVGARRELFPWVLKLMLPHAALRLTASSSDQVVESLLAGTIDLGISHLRPNVLHILSHRVFTSGTLLAVHERWLKGRPLSLDLAKKHEFLVSVPCLSYGEKDRVLELWLNYAGFLKSNLSVQLTYDDWPTLLRLVEEGEGFCFLPENMRTRSARIRYINVDSVIPRWTYYLLYQGHLRSHSSIREIIKSSKEKSKIDNV